jgi:predicted ATP-grasp superfamily ATP-dependent carboligase
MIDQLIALARRVEGKPILMPTDDHFAQVLARHRLELEEVAIPCVAPSEAVELLVDQQRFCEWGQANDISCPKAVPASDAPGSLPMPFVVKPANKSAFQVVARKLQRGKRPSHFRCRFIHSMEEWQVYTEEIGPNLDHILAQEFIEGTTSDMYSIGVYADRHSCIKGLFVGRKLRGFPALYGDTKLGQNDRVPDEVLDEVTHIVRALQYTGVAEFEYKREPGTGRFRLIEINPRCWSWIGASTVSRADISWIAFQDLTGANPDDAIENDAPGSIKYVQIISDFVNVFFRYRWDYPGWVMGPRAWWKSLEAEKLVIAEFNQGDWLVAVFYVAWVLRDASEGLLAWLRKH